MKSRRPSSIKKQNIAVILELIKSEGPISRMDIARTTELSVPAVSQLVAELLAMDLVEEVGLASSTGGRPARLLQINSHSGFYIGVHVGVETMTSAVVDAIGRVMVRKTMDTHGIENPFFRLIGLIRDTLLATELSPESIRGVGVGVPGVVDPLRHVVQHSAALDWGNFDIRAQLAQCFRMPVWAGNTMEARVRGEKWRGLLQGINHGVALQIDHEIRMGFLLNGQVYAGKGGAAGRLSSWMLKQTGLADIALASRSRRPAIAEQLGLVLINLSVLLDLEQVVLSGQVTGEGTDFLQSIQDIVQEQVSDPPTIVMTGLHEDAGILGAVDAVAEMLKQDRGY